MWMPIYEAPFFPTNCCNVVHLLVNSPPRDAFGTEARFPSQEGEFSGFAAFLEREDELLNKDNEAAPIDDVKRRSLTAAKDYRR